MDITSPFKSEIFRPLVTLVIPGAVALAPYILVVAYYFPEVVIFWNEHPSAFVAILVVSVVTTGLILENLGRRLSGTCLTRYSTEGIAVINQTGKNI